ncbi:MAG: DUF1015 domain-containing protein [Deltaproteobacteria bacterium]|nr:MAG: DUF1015 domain-containing protein [Deltaproteobacteria bacterium]
MTQIRPFRALRYDPARVELSRAIAPPYDVIAPDERGSYFERDPHNAIRLELTREVADEATTDYGDAKATLAAWRDEGALRLDATPAIYGLRQRFAGPDGAAHERAGFFALLHLEDYARCIVRPHERTLSGPKRDRLKLLRATEANFSGVFMLYEDPDQKLAAVLSPLMDRGPTVAGRDEQGTEHRLTRIDALPAIEAARAFLAERSVVIADGHHRYETALAYRDECRARGAAADAPFEWILAYFANAYAPGSLLLPIHRLILAASAPTETDWRERLPGWSQRTVPVSDAASIPALLAETLHPLRGSHAFAADDGSDVLRIFSRARAEADELTIRQIHEQVLPRVFGLTESAVRDGAIEYRKDAERAARDVRAGRAAVALYVNALAPEEVFRVTAAGEVLPQKSTLFLPKIPTGLLFRVLGEDA